MDAQLLVYFVDVTGLATQQREIIMNDFKIGTKIESDKIIQLYIETEDVGIIEDVRIFNINDNSLIILYQNLEGMTRAQANEKLSKLLEDVSLKIHEKCPKATIQVLPTKSENKIKIMQLWNDKYTMIRS